MFDRMLNKHYKHIMPVLHMETWVNTCITMWIICDMNKKQMPYMKSLL